MNTSFKKQVIQSIHVPYGKTVHGEEEIEAVVKVLRSSTQMGVNVKEMEKKVASIFSKHSGIMVNSGSSANYLAVEILNMKEGDEVITPALTFSTTVAPLIKNKLIPAFVDVEPGTYNINADAVQAMITPKTKCMMIPNLLGNLPVWPQLKEIADRYHLTIIEDSADTLGAKINGQSASVYSDITTTSFYGSHVINCAGNGGMLCVNSKEEAEKAKLLRSWGRRSSLFVESEAIENRFNVDIDGIPYDSKFIFDVIGYNLEPSEMGAAFGLVQLKKLNENILSREKWFKSHLEFFSSYEDWFILPKQLPNSVTGWLAFPLTIRSTAPFTRTQMQIFLEKRNIQTRTIFTGNILRHPGFKNIPCKRTREGYPCADQVMQGGILLACHHGLNAEMVNYIQDSFCDFAAQFGR
jgi:CDP-6-deoxy-D-xylo-4-hexulose-3-dehydrase